MVVLELWFNIILALNDGDFLLCGDDNDDDDDDGCGGVDDDNDGDGRGSDGANNDDKGDGDDSCFIKIIIKVLRTMSIIINLICQYKQLRHSEKFMGVVGRWWGFVGA